MSDLKARLLVVDYEAPLRTCLAEIFTEMGYAVRVASDGFSASESIREETPDLVLSDLYMPVMSGFELLSVIRRRVPSISANRCERHLFSVKSGTQATLWSTSCRAAAGTANAGQARPLAQIDR
jgi:CheY-like chemotaxis protein